MNRGLVLFSLLLSLLLPSLTAQEPLGIPRNEFSEKPTAARCKNLIDRAALSSWEGVANEAREAAFSAFSSGHLEAASDWLNLSRWLRLLGTSEEDFIKQWMKDIEAAGLAHANMPGKFALRPRIVLATWIPSGLQAQLAADARFLAEFFEELSPYDFLPGVLRNLSQMQAAAARDFEEFESLALAIGLVYDCPPPPDWPHGQVNAGQLVRKFPPPEKTLAFFAELSRSKRSLHKLSKLRTAELKYLVDILASFEDLRWAAQVVNPPLDKLEQAYKAIRYRVDRLRNDTHNWVLPNYNLPLILAQGGICVDQAYFATQAAKARGVPTLLFTGKGKDGRHAWFGFLDGKGNWQLNAGRYAEQRFVTGLALDPQTWSPINDHELQFMAEGFHTQAAARLSKIHSAFALEFLLAGHDGESGKAARQALKLEKRNLDAYTVLEKLLGKTEDSAREREKLWREAIIATARYPDLESAFTRKLTDSLRKRGETSLADAEERRLIRKYQGERTDLSIEQSATILARSFAQDEVPAQLRTYNMVLEQYGKGAGMAFFDGIVVVFVEHLVQIGQPAEAQKALTRARAVLKVEAGSQLDKEFERIQKRLH